MLGECGVNKQGEERAQFSVEQDGRWTYQGSKEQPGGPSPGPGAMEPSRVQGGEW